MQMSGGERMLKNDMRVNISHAGLALILFYAYDFFYIVTQKVTSNDILTKVITLGIMYTIYIISCLKSSNKEYLKGFIVIFICIMMFILTYLFHPEYADVMIYAPSWNIWKSVFTFSSGIFACLFFSIFDNPNHLRKYLRYAGYILLLWCLIRIYSSMANGGFQRISEHGKVSYNTYDMLLGYRLLFISIIFSIEYMENKKRNCYISISIIAFILMVIYGSRTAIISFIVFWVLKILFYDEGLKYKKHIVKIVALLVLIFIIYAIFTDERILIYINKGLMNIGLNSRMLNTLLEGNIVLDKGRNRMWSTVWYMIIKHPIIGNGIYADRYELGIYCHQIILEILLDFGIILGCIIILFLVYKLGEILITCKKDEWKLLFILFLSMVIVRLNVSSTFWGDTNFWACLVMGNKVLNIKYKSRLKVKLS